MVDFKQFRIENFNIDRVKDRTIEELLGLSRGLLADGAINEAEARFLSQWLERHFAFHCEPPFNFLVERLRDYMADGRIDDDELEDLRSILQGLAGREVIVGSRAALTSTTFPLTQPVPPVYIRDRAFCFTGIFIHGSRAKCHADTLDRDGIIKTCVSPLIDYLVIGDISSPVWINTSFGRKIQGALELVKAGKDVGIISEETWLKALEQNLEPPSQEEETAEEALIEEAVDEVCSNQGNLF